MADYPFLDPGYRIYGRLSRMVACARYILDTAAKGIRSENKHWRIKRDAGYGGTQDGHTVTWLIRNYPGLPNNDWRSPGERIPGEPTLTASVELGFRVMHRVNPEAASLCFPPAYSYEDGKPEASGSCYALLLHTSLSYSGADGAWDTIYSKSLPLTMPASVDSILNDVGAALRGADSAFATYLPLHGMDYSDPVPPPPGPWRIIGREYNAMLRDQADNEAARAIGEEFRLWCRVHKGVDTIAEGLRVCTTAELMDWFARISSMGWYAQRRIGDDMGRRVLAYDAERAASMESALLPIKHVDPWGGDGIG